MGEGGTRYKGGVALPSVHSSQKNYYQKNLSQYIKYLYFFYFYIITYTYR